VCVADGSGHGVINFDTLRVETTTHSGKNIS
jgi:hypothetical protein